MYQKHRLSNGVRVIFEKIPHVRSVSIGFWIGSGSIHENTVNNGITHFIEHMMFKGTERRSAKEIAETIDNIGGQLNAFTSKECTCYYTKVLDAHLPIAVDILTDMLFHSTFDPTEIEKEKGVVIEEINMYEDSPEDIAHDLLSNIVFKHHSLGLPILGNQDTIKDFDRDTLMGYIKENYTNENIVISVAGNFDEDALINMLEQRFMDSPLEKTLNERAMEDEPSFITNTSIRYKDIEQLHLCIGIEGVSLTNKDLYPLLVTNNIFGGSMSSRLFQNIREDKGLAYSVFSYPSSYKNIGLFTIYGGINPAQLSEVCRLISEEVYKMKNDGLTSDELAKSKEQLKGNYILGLESTSSRMTAIGKSELLLNKIYTQKEILEKIDSITMEEVSGTINRIFDLKKASIAVVGKIDTNMDVRSLLKN